MINSTQHDGPNYHAVFEAIVPNNIIWEYARIDDAQGQLFTAEAEGTKYFSTARLREFTAGRVVARRCLERVGLKDVSIPRLLDRQPSWPKNIVGSISHTNDEVVCILASDDFYRGIGIDWELDRRLDPQLDSLILHPTERSHDRSDLESIDESPGILIFAIKEAIYKAVNPITRLYLDFLDVIVDLRQTTSVAPFVHGEFQARILEPRTLSALSLSLIYGSWAKAHGHICAVCTVPIDQRP